MTLIDIGCNLGAFTLAAAMNGFPVLCVEALHQSLERLDESLIDNGLKEYVTLLHNAVVEKRGTYQVNVM